MATWPIPLPKWFWVWARWYLGHGEFAGNPRDPDLRPPSAPAKIPQWAWDRLKLIAQPKPPPGPVLFSQPQGAFLRDPRGGVEDVAEMRAAGYSWLALNVGDYLPDAWEIVRTRAAAAGVRAIPWARCYTTLDVQKLVAVDKVWSSKAFVINLENEAETVLSPARCEGMLVGNTSEIAYSTLGWLQNGVDWKPLANRAVLLQLFRNELPWLRTDQCIYHAHELGCRFVYPTWGAYAVDGVKPDPLIYELDMAAWSVYTGDDIGVGQWKMWC